LLVYNIYRFNKEPLRIVPIIPALGLVIQAISYVLDRIDKTEQWTDVHGGGEEALNVP
jgi:hypothetical protein